MKGAIAQIGATGLWQEAEIPIKQDMKGELVEGQFEIEIEYGRLGNKKFRMIKKFKPSIRFDQSGDIEVADITEVP